MDITFPDWRKARVISTNKLDQWETFDDIYLPLPPVKGQPHRWLFIKRGFRTDCASIPRIARVFYTPTNPKWRAAAIGHDGLYSAELLPRSEADDAIAYWMKLQGNNWARRKIFWLAVRGGGGFVWGDHTPKSIADARKYCSIIVL